MGSSVTDTALRYHCPNSALHDPKNSPSAAGATPRWWTQDRRRESPRPHAKHTVSNCCEGNVYLDVGRVLWNRRSSRNHNLKLPLRCLTEAVLCTTMINILLKGETKYKGPRPERTVNATWLAQKVHRAENKQTLSTKKIPQQNDHAWGTYIKEIPSTTCLTTFRMREWRPCQPMASFPPSNFISL